MKNKGYVKDLIVKIDDKNLKEVSLVFLKNIESEFEKFKKEYDKYEKNNSKYLNNHDFEFFPEKLAKKSPLTIINAPWGTGKTFFIENFLKLFIDKEIESKIFEKMIIIDAWKFSNSKDIPAEFITQLTNKLIKTHLSNVNDEKIKNKMRVKMLKKFLSLLEFSYIIKSDYGLEQAWKLSFKEQNNDTNKEEIDYWSKIENNQIKTIIFIDNIERLGSLSWDLLKAVLKLQEFENYLIILTLNLNMLKHNINHNNEKKDINEYPIEKYVDFNYYNFKQDYSNFFKKYFKNASEDFLITLEQVFNFEIDGEKLSIREVERLFKKHEIFEIKHEYEILRKIKKEIWDANEIFSKFIKSEITNFINREIKKNEFFNKILDQMSKKTDLYPNEYINLNPNVIGAYWYCLNSIFNDGTYLSRAKYKVNFDYSKAFNACLEITENRKKELTKEINNLTQLNLSETEKINEKKQNISKFERKNEDLNIQITQMKNGNYENHDDKMLVDWKNMQAENLEMIERINEEIKEFENNIKENNKNFQNKKCIKNSIESKFGELENYVMQYNLILKNQEHNSDKNLEIENLLRKKLHNFDKFNLYSINEDTERINFSNDFFY